MAATPVLTVQDAIDRVGFVRFQRRLLLVCGVTWAADAAEILLLAFALPVISAEFSLSRAAGGLLITSTFLGMLIGAWFWGWWPTGSAAGPASSSPSSSSPYSGPVGAGPQPGHADGAAGADRVRAGGRPAARLCRVRRVPAQPQPGPQPGAGELLGAGARSPPPAWPCCWSPPWAGGPCWPPPPWSSGSAARCPSHPATWPPAATPPRPDRCSPKSPRPTGSPSRPASCRGPPAARRSGWHRCGVDPIETQDERIVLTSQAVLHCRDGQGRLAP
jgi:hypothetical protein